MHVNVIQFSHGGDMSGLGNDDTRTTLLTWLLRSLLGILPIVLIIIFIDNPIGDPARKLYGWMVGILFFMLIIAYILLVKGWYVPSAIMTVLVPMLGAWSSLLFDYSVSHGDIFPLLYVIFSIMLSSLLLPELVTILLASIQFLLLAGVVLWIPAYRPLNCVSFLIFIFIASLLSIITNHMLGNRLKELHAFAITDELTGLLNRRYLEIALNQQLQTDRRFSESDATTSFGVILLDIDRFKSLNDQYGHPAGDLVLLEFSRLLHRILPIDAIPCRYGGDEFAIIVHTHKVGDTIRIAETLREEVKHMHLHYREKNIGPISITLGVAQYPQHGNNKVSLIFHADESLLKAKQDGRDRVGCTVL
jgi:diguanylate cyclase (GGDEF)-like protein